MPDGLVTETTIEDWQRFLDLVRAEGWRSEWAGRETLDSAHALFADDELHTLKVWPIESLQVNVFPLEETSLDCDFDSRELTGDGLCACFAFLRAVGQALGKPVLLKYEGADAPAFARYDPESDDVIAEEPPPQ